MGWLDNIIAGIPRRVPAWATSTTLQPWLSTCLPSVQAPCRLSGPCSGQCGGQDPGLASDAVAQQPDGHVRFEFPLNCAQHVRGGPAQDSHDGGRVAGATCGSRPPETARPGCGAGRSPLMRSAIRNQPPVWMVRAALNCSRRRICFVPKSCGQRPEPALHRPDSPTSRDFVLPCVGCGMVSRVA